MAGIHPLSQLELRLNQLVLRRVLHRKTSVIQNVLHREVFSQHHSDRPIQSLLACERRQGTNQLRAPTTVMAGIADDRRNFGFVYPVELFHSRHPEDLVWTPGIVELGYQSDFAVVVNETLTGEALMGY